MLPLTAIKKFIRITALLVAALFMAAPISAQETLSREDFKKPFSWRTLHSEHFHIEYLEGDSNQKLAEQALNVSEQALAELSKKFNWQPRFKIHIAINQQTDQVNGYATPLPFNRIVIFTPKPSQFNELSDYHGWLKDLLLHELTHIVHLDKAHRMPKALRYVIGRNALFFPALFQPNFLTEGLATYIETSWERGTGRGQSAYFQMQMRQEVANGLKDLATVQQNHRSWPLNTDYLYGVYFYQFLDEQYGPETVEKYVAQYSDNIIPFLVSSNVKKTTGVKNIETLWADYKAWLTNKFQPQIDELNAATLSPTKIISKTAYFNGRPISDTEGNSYYVAFDKYRPTYIMRYNNDAKKPLKRLQRVKGSSRLIGVIDEQLYYLQESFCKHNQKTFDLYSYSLSKKHNKRLSKCARYIDAAINEKQQLFAISEHNGSQHLVLYNIKTQTEKTLYVAKQSQSFSSPSWYDENTLILSHKEGEKPWRIDWFSISDKNLSTFIDDDIIAYYTPRINKADNSIYVASDKNRLLEIYKVDIPSKAIQQVTRSLGGAFYPSIDEKNQRLVFNSYQADGWNIGQLPLNQPIEQQAIKPIDYNKQGFDMQWNDDFSTEFTDKPYQAWRSLWPRTWSMQGYNSGQSNEQGITVSGNDSLSFHQYTLGVSYDSKNSATSGIVQYTLYNHFSFSVGRRHEFTKGQGVQNDENTFDKEIDFQAAFFNYRWPFKFSSLSFFTGIVADQENTTFIPQGSTTFENDITTYGLGFIFSNTSNSLYSISESFGRKIKITAEHDRLKRQSTLNNGSKLRSKTSGDVFTIDWREFIHLYKAHTIALRAFYAKGESGTDPFSLAGENSDLFSEKPSIQDRDQQLRAYPTKTQELSGTEAVIFAAEYRFPLYYLDRGLEGWPIGLNDISGTVFYEQGDACFGCGSFDYLAGTGFEINLKLDIGYGLPLQISGGYAKPLDSTNRNRDKGANAYLRFSSSF